MRNKPNFRIISFVLVAVLIATSVFVALPFALADDTPVNAYYALKGYQNGVGPADANWKYDALVLKANTPFENSDDSFLAPTVQMSENAYNANITWSSVSGAASYDVNMYHMVSNAYEPVFETNVETTSFNAVGLTKGDTIFVQIIALDVNGQKIAASHIKEFTAFLVSDVFVMLNDASNSSTYTSTFPNTTATTAVPDGNGISYQTSTQKTITFNFPQTNLLNYTAIGFYIDNSANTTPYSYYGMKVGNTTVTQVLKDTNRPGSVDVNAQGYKDNGDKFAVNTADWEDNCWDIQAGEKGWYTFDLNRSAATSLYNATSISFLSHGWFNASTEAHKNKTVLIDNLVAIKDLDAFQSYLKSGDQTKSNTFKHVVVDEGIYECNTFDATANTLKNDIVNTGYTFNYNDTEGALRFNMVDTGANQIGAALKFVAPVDGLFDISSSFIINGNSEPLTAYYRVVKTDLNGTETVVWPTNADWHTFDATATDLNPYGDVRVAEANLKAGESARIEAYAKFTDGAGSVNAILASPMANVVNRTVDAKGTSTTYKFLDYDYNLNDAGLTAGLMTMYPTESRVNFEIVNLTTNTVYPLNKIVINWNNFASSTAMGDNSGFYFAPNYTDFIAASPTNGVQMRIIAPYDSTLMYKSSFPASPNADRIKYRVVINDVVVYPTTGDFANASGVLNVACDVKAGDDVCIQLFETTGTGRSGGSLAAATATFTKGNTHNLSTNTKFNALLERPYEGENYTGEYINPEAAVFGFEIIDFASDSYLPVNMFDYSKDNFLYNSASEGTGFNFGEESLGIKMSQNKTIQLNAGYGTSIAFVAPVVGIYDVSAPIKLIDGEGTVAARITVNGETVWPTNYEWQTFENATAGTVINLPAQEIQLSANQVVRIELGAYETKSDMVFDLGQPTFVINNNRVASEKGYISIYTPAEYVPLYVADNYDGNITDASSRFNFNFFKLTDASIVAADKYDTTVQNKYYADDISAAYYLSDGKIEFETDGTYGASLDFISPMNGMSVISVTTANGTELAVYKNNEKIYPTDSDYAVYDGNIIQIPDIDLKVDDTISVKYKTVAGKFDIGMPSISITGVHKDDNTATGTVFYPVSADPYKGDNYTGPYEQKYDIWNFETFNVKTKDTEPVNYFDGVGKTRYVYNTNMLNTGYSLNVPELQAMINNGTDAHGTKVTLTIPYAENFEIQSSAMVVTENAEATVHVRITQNGVNIWPTDSEWCSKTLTTGQSIDIPFMEMQLSKGDELSFEMYAENIKVNGAAADSILLSYGVPKVNVCTATVFEAPDATAKVYPMTEYNPYGKLAYAGPHFLKGDNRWQVKAIDPNDGNINIVDMKNYNYTWAHNLYYNGDFTTGVLYYAKWLEGALVAKRVANTDPNATSSYKMETYGLSLIFNAPSENRVLATGAPQVTGNTAEQIAANAQIKFRVIHTDASGNVTTLWPNTGDWETISVNNRASKFPGAEVDMKLGDTIEYQYYIADATFTDDVTSVRHQLELKAPSVMVVTPSTSEKTTYNSTSDFTKKYSISPYWKYQYALDKENPVWKDLEYFGNWDHWSASYASNYLCLKGDSAWIINKNMGDRSGSHFNNGGDANYGMVAYKFINPKDGWITIPTGTVSTNTEKAQARIVYNGEVVWPSGGGWQPVATKATYEKMVFEVKKGDWFRFEMTIDEETVVDWEHSRVMWQAVLKYSDRDPAFTAEAGDIWSGVDKNLLEYFKTLNSELQFDIDYLTHKAEADASQEIVSSEQKGHYEYVLKENAGNDKKEPQQQQVIRRKKVVVVNGGIPVWLIVVIACGAIVLVGGAVTLIILKKKGIIFTPAVVADDQGDENESPTDQDSGSEN